MLTNLRLFTITLAPSLKKIIASVFILAICTLALPSYAIAQTSSYILDVSDVVAISVYDEEELSFEEIRISDTGIITYPFLGELMVTGNTLSSFESLIRQGLINGEFLINPEITVSIVEYRPFYIDGEVDQPGSYPFEPGLTLRKAVSIAGGFTERASKTKITIRHANSDLSEETSFTESLDVDIKSGDIITVEERFF